MHAFLGNRGRCSLERGQGRPPQDRNTCNQESRNSSCLLNWGLGDEDLETLPPSVVKAFGFDKESHEFGDRDFSAFEVKEDDHDGGVGVSTLRNDSFEEVSRRTKGIGFDIGPIKLGDGKTVEGGRKLMQNTWNMELPPDLTQVYQEGQKIVDRPDLWINKNRMSGFCAANQHTVQLLKDAGVTTLLFAETKTDVCDMASLLDAWHAGFDVVLFDI